MLRPIALTQFVAGDSAKHYARLYERDTRWANRVAAVGTVLALTGFMATHVCSTSVCTNGPRHGAPRVTEIVGVSLFAVAIPIKLYGRNQGYKAVSFYNAALGR